MVHLVKITNNLKPIFNRCIDFYANKYLQEIGKDTKPYIDLCKEFGTNEIIVGEHLVFKSEQHYIVWLLTWG